MTLFRNEGNTVVKHTYDDIYAEFVKSFKEEANTLISDADIEKILSEEEARLAKEKEEAEKKQAAAKAEPADEMVAFEKRIKKLMIMKNTGILTEAEFEEEKKKLFELL